MILTLISAAALLSAQPTVEGSSSIPASLKGIVEAPPAGMGQVVFYRRGTLIGGGISCAVKENGEKVSSLPPGRYFVVAAKPGIHEYTVSSEATDRLRIEVEPGETYYNQCAIGMGIGLGRPNLSPVTADDFAARVQKLKLVKKKK